MKRVFLTAILALMVIGMAGTAFGQDSLNVRRVGVLSGNWHSALGVAVNDTVAYLTTGTDGFHIVNVSNPAHPVEIGSCATQANRVTVVGTLAYLAGNGRLSVVDVSNPAAPVELGSVAGLETSDWIWDINVSGGTAYVVAEVSSGEESDQYLAVFDVSDPAHPVFTGWQGFVILFGVAVNGDYVYLSQADIGFTICTRANPFTPVHSTYAIHPVQVKTSGAYAYLSGDGQFLTMSLADPANPVQVGSCTLPMSCACHLAVSGPYAFVADPYASSMRVVSLMDPSAPAQTGFYTRYRQIRDLAAQGSTVYMAEDSVLVIYDCSQAAGTMPSVRAELPQSVRLDPCYPNPFNASTTIRYELPVNASVSLSVFDVLGRRVADLATGQQTAGTHELRFDGSTLGSGVYFVHLSAGDYQTQQKVVLLK